MGGKGGGGKKKFLAYKFLVDTVLIRMFLIILVEQNNIMVTMKVPGNGLSSWTIINCDAYFTGDTIQ